MINPTFIAMRLRSAFRTPDLLIWIFAFPIILYTVLTLIFGNIGAVEGINFKVALLDQAEEGTGTQIIHSIFDELSYAGEGKSALFTFERVNNIEAALEMLRMNKVSLIVEIPEDFNQKFHQILLFGAFLGDRVVAPEIILYEIDVRQGSRTARDIMDQILSSVNAEAARRMNRDLPEIQSRAQIVGRTETFSYPDFFLVGVLLMSIFSVGFFGVGADIAWLKSEGVLKRFVASPLTTKTYMSSLIVEQLVTIFCSFLILLSFSVLVFGATFSILRPQALIFVILGIVTSLSFGLALGTLAKTPRAAAGLGNALFFPMQFLGGLYFPVFDLPPAIQWFVYINPLTWLSTGMRHEMQLVGSPYPAFLHYLVPVLWISVLLVFTLRKFRWEVD